MPQLIRSKQPLRHCLISGIEGGNAAPAPPHKYDRSLNLPVLPEYDRPGFRAWESFLLNVLKYVEDNILHKKLCMEGLVIGDNREKCARATKSQNLFKQITRIAEMLGMKVNSDKTMLVCISESRSYKARPYIKTSEGDVISSVDKLKILGMHFSSRPDMSAQVESICQKFRAIICLRFFWGRLIESVQVYNLTLSWLFFFPFFFGSISNDCVGKTPG